jgi:hypothetical protein
MTRDASNHMPLVLDDPAAERAWLDRWVIADPCGARRTASG